MKLNHKQILLGILSLAVPISIAFSTPLPLDIRAGQKVARNLPTGSTLVEKMESFCKARNIQGDLCNMGYAATLTADAMSKAGYSAKDTIATIAQAGYEGIAAYENARLGELTAPLIGIFNINGGSEFMIKYGLATKEDAATFARLFNKQNQRNHLRSQGHHEMKARQIMCPENDPTISQAGRRAGGLHALPLRLKTGV